jgi:CBS domain-containing protein
MRIREHMTPDPVTLPSSTTLVDAARTMRDADIGDVLVVDGTDLVGVATDRDVVVRGIAEGCDPASTKLSEVCTGSVVTVGPDDSVADAERLMREHAIRRVAVVENGRPVGIVSIGDLAVDLDQRSALADISAAPANS